MNPFRNSSRMAALAGTLLLMWVISASSQNISRELAVQLAGENHAASALEFRRAAKEVSVGVDRGAYCWAAAYEYIQAGDYERAVMMLDRAEDAHHELSSLSMILRSEAVTAQDNPVEASFYLQSVADNEGVEDDARRWAVRKLSAVSIRGGDPAGAKRLLRQYEEDDAAVYEAIEKYEKASRKSPVLGGILGVIPGLGYIYSGEYANAARSMILNGLFIYGMMDTADDGEWGAFSVITFFELTWYSGSIYGGIDSAHRYNERELNTCLDAVGGSVDMKADLAAIPVISLRFTF